MCVKFLHLPARIQSRVNLSINITNAAKAATKPIAVSLSLPALRDAIVSQVIIGSHFPLLYNRHWRKLTISCCEQIANDICTGFILFNFCCSINVFLFLVIV